MSQGESMNERDIVFREILRGNPNMTGGQAEDLIDALADSVAHTLAVEQRAIVKLRGLPLDDGNTQLGDIIDHIDPRVPFEAGGPAPREQPGVGDDAA